MKYSKAGLFSIIILMNSIATAQICPNPLVVKQILNKGENKVRDLSLSYTQTQGSQKDIKELSFQGVRYIISGHQVAAKSALTCFYNAGGMIIHLSLDGRYSIVPLGVWSRASGGGNAEVYACINNLEACSYHVIHKN